MTQSLWNQNSHLNIKLGEQLSLKAFIILTILVKLYLAKMCPIFASSSSNCLKRYKQILAGCLLGCKNALNFSCLFMKFHNRVHTIIHYKPVFACIWNSQNIFPECFDGTFQKFFNKSYDRNKAVAMLCKCEIMHIKKIYRSQLGHNLLGTCVGIINSYSENTPHDLSSVRFRFCYTVIYASNC